MFHSGAHIIRVCGLLLSLLALMFPFWFGVVPQTSGSSSFHFYSVVSAIFNPDRWWNCFIHVIQFDLHSQCCFLFVFYWNPIKDKAKGAQCQITLAAAAHVEAGLLSFLFFFRKAIFLVFIWLWFVFKVFIYVFIRPIKAKRARWTQQCS